jgi:hypothetical protein
VNTCKTLVGSFMIVSVMNTVIQMYIYTDVHFSLLIVSYVSRVSCKFTMHNDLSRRIGLLDQP